MKLEFSLQIVGNYSYMKFHENPSSESRFVLCGQTERRDEDISSFLQICEPA